VSDQEQPFDQFLLWEQTTRDTIDFKTIYVDMADDLVAGLVLSQIVFWHLPNHQGRSKLRVRKDGHYWIAKGREDWYDEIRVTAKQIDRALGILEKLGIIVTALYKFDGAPTKHIRIDSEGFLTAWRAIVQERGKSISTKGENPTGPTVEMDITETGKSLTETTSETTTEKTAVADSSVGDDWPDPPTVTESSTESPLKRHTRMKAETGDDPVADMVKRAQSPKPRDWATPAAAAGGDDPWLGPPTRMWCAFIGLNYEDVPDRRLGLFAGDLRDIAQQVSAKPEKTARAIRAMASRDEYNWLRSASRPTHRGFAEALLNVLCGQKPRTPRGNGSSVEVGADGFRTVPQGSIGW